MLIEEIKKDLIAFQKEKNETGVSSLRMLVASIVNKEKDKRLKISGENPDFNEEELSKKSVLTDEETMEAISSEVKKRRDSILSFEKGGRSDLVAKETKELEILKKYLPEEMGEEEIRNLVKEAVTKTNARGMKDIGLVMKEIVPRTKARADGNLVARIVKEELSAA
ncbi:MAG: GatB/YqeY domain-containing protein [Candidatus Pacebacteria bacterium]|nr:GatB/YqeY domain-containing protein [Candidatus Paceibacterota bacterium]